VITGPSGFGKTTIGLRLERQWGDSRFIKLLLLRARTFAAGGDLEREVSDQLGGLGSPIPLSLVRLERWLTEAGLQLVLFVDGINEFSPDLSRCVDFFRGIMRSCYFLPEANSAIRIVATVRQETWNAMLPHLDVAHLRQVMWSDAGSDSMATIVCGRFNDSELSDALEKLDLLDGNEANLAEFSASTLAQLRDPYLLRTLAEAGRSGAPLLPSPMLLKRAIEEKLRKSGSSIREATLAAALSDLALTRLEDAQAKFREVDLHPAALRDDLVRTAKDLNILVDAGSGFLQFDHDRTFEYFLAVGFGSGDGPPLDSLENLSRFLHRFKPASRPYAAARVYFQLHVESAFEVVAAALQAFASRPDRSDAERERLFAFAREVLIQLAEAHEATARAYLGDAAEAARAGRLEERHLRTVVQAIAALPTDEAVKLLGYVAGGSAQLAAVEAQIYAIMKLAARFLRDQREDVDLLEDAPYAQFFADPAIPVWSRIGRVAAFAWQVGPDNCHPAEYGAFRRSAERALQQLCSLPQPLDTAAAVTRHFLADCDRLMFNATHEGIDRFFANPGRTAFLEILDRLSAGQILTDQDFAIFEPYIQSLAFDVEYQLAHMLFVLSSLNGLDETLALAERRFSQFTNATAPEEVDFFMAVLVYLHIVHDRPYDADRFGAWEVKVLDEWPDVLLYRPGLQRGERRGFTDAFDRFFEDGFGVLFPYGILMPGNRRRTRRWKEESQNRDTPPGEPLPLYAEHLRKFLRESRIDEALQVLQALASVVMVWPDEGLASLASVVGHPDQRIQRAVVRILAEAFARHPVATQRFLNASGLALSDDELLQIKIRQDARLGRRQVNEEEWGRLMHLLIALPGARQTLTDCVRELIVAASVHEAAQAIVRRLGLQAGR
jgi:hypothetical protein